MGRKLSKVLRRLTGPALAAVVLGAGLVTQAPTADVSEAQTIASGVGQTHYLPWDAQQFQDILVAQEGDPDEIDSPIRLITSFVSAVDGNTVAIDHWEDGYDADPIGAPGSTTELLTLDEGDPQLLDNLVDLTQLGDPGYIRYDGGDKLVSTGAIVVNMGGWPSTATTLHAGSVVVREVNSYGYEFVSPVGEDITYSAPLNALSTLWEYVGLVVVASEDATTVTLPDATTVALDEGDSHLVNGGVHLGDTVTADKPIGVFLATGDNGASYEGRLYGLLPTEAWFDGYVTPVGSRNQTDQATRVFLYNPGSSPIAVGWESSGGTTGSVSVPAGGQGTVRLPTNQGMRFTSPGNPFYALQAITTPEDGATDRSSAYNWGLALTPARALTPMVVIGYGPGSENFAENDSPVWVTAQADANLLVDLDADPETGALTDPDGNQYDFACPVTELTPVLIKDIGGASCSSVTGFTNTVNAAGDADMTGARIYSDNGASIVAAWGQVPGLNSVQPAIDMGTAVIPFPVIDLQKDAEILGDDGDGLVLPGDTVRYTIQAINRGIAPIDDLLLTDDLPEHVSYVPGTTVADGNPVADSGSGTAFPLDEGILLPPAIEVGQTRVVTFDVVVDDPLPLDVDEVVNLATLETDYGTYTDIATTPTTPTGSIGDRVWDDADGDGVQDGSEAGLVGVTVELLDDGGSVLATTTTGANGAYGFGDLYPGTYTVRVDPTSLPAGRAPTHDLDGTGTAHEAQVVLAADEDRTDADFGYATSTITLEKTVYAGHDGGSGCPGTELASGESGDDVTYCFRVTNTGALAVTAVGVDDPDLGVDQSAMALESGTPASLGAGQSVVWSYETTVDGDLVNEAEAEAFLGSFRLSATDTAEVDEIGPGISIEKTVYAGHDGGASCAGGELLQVRAGDAVTYCFLVTNTGETTLSAVSVTDDDLGIGPGDLTHALLTPGQAVTLHAEAQADGDLVNTASVVGTSPAGVQPTDSDTAEVDEIHPAIQVDKTVALGDSDGAACPGVEQINALDGDTTTWCFTVTNTGDVDLTDVRLDDPALLADEADMTVSSGSLASLPVGGSVSLHLEGTASADLANTVDAAATPPVGPDVEDADDAAVNVITPGIEVQKTVYEGHDGGAGCSTAGESVMGVPGTEVTWCFEVTNLEDSSVLNGVTLDDTDLGLDETDLTVLSGDLATVPADGTVRLAYEGTIDGDLVNTVTATGTPPLGPDVSDDDTAEVDEVNAGIALDKAVYGGGPASAGSGCATADGDHADEGGTPVTWCFTITNTGDAPLTDLRLDDADLGVDEADLTVLSGSLASLAPEASVVLYTTGTVDGDLVNTATATGTPPVGPDVSDDDTAEVDELVPAVEIDKTVYAGHDDGASCPGGELVVARPGDAVTWCIEVRNTGDTDLDGDVTDADIGLDEVIDLGPGDSEAFVVEGVVDGDLLNTATVEADSPAGRPVSDSDTAEVDEVNPAIAVQKTVYGGHDDGAGCPGDDTFADEDGQPVTWCFVVSNLGDTPLTDVRLDDVDLGVDQADLTVRSGSLASVGAGDSVVLYLEGALDGDLVNDVTVTGTPVVGPDVEDEDSAEVDVLEPGVEIRKTVYAGDDDGTSCEGGERVYARAGAEVTWCFRVTNTGEVPLDVTVDDPDIGFTGTVTGLAPGADETLFHVGTVDGDLVNVATATGETPDGDEVVDDDDAEVDEIHPDVEVQKTVDAGHDGASCPGDELLRAEVGDDATWCFVITNPGDVTLTDVDLTDTVLGIDESDVTVLSGSLASLPPDGTIRARYHGTVTEDLVNTVTVGGTAPDDSRETDSDTAEVEVIAPQVGLAKTVVEGPTGNGDGTYTLTYRLRVANAGETALREVQVTDDLTDTFVGVESFRVDDLTSDDLTVNWPGYTGRPGGSVDLLAGVDTLGVGERGDLHLTVTVRPGNALGPHQNTAWATATSPGGEDVDDTSDSGTDADPTSSNPGEPGDTPGGTDDPVPVEFPPVDLGVTKTVEDTRMSGAVGTAHWRVVVTNNGPGDDPGPITVVDDLDERLRFVSAEGDGWVCGAVGRRVICSWDAPLAAGEVAPEIRIVTETTITRDETIPNVATVSSSLDESRTDNNEAEAGVEAVVGGDTGGGMLPRTGTGIAGLVALGLGLLLGGRILQRRARPAS